MGIYYYKLWNLMSKKGITQKTISSQAHISTATLTKMRNNEKVSLDVLDRICELLNCDFGDIITSKENKNTLNVDWKNDTAAKKANGVYRFALENYMKKKQLTFANVSLQTGLALNTVKDFLKSKELSSRSILKLMHLGTEYNEQVDKILQHNERKSKVYCKHPFNKSKHCFGYRTQWNSNTKMYDEYCLYNFNQTYDSSGNLVTNEDCPHPQNTKEMTVAIKQYGSYLRGEKKFIPAKRL